MRLNKFIAQASGLSRRAADTAIANGRVKLNGSAPPLGADVATDDTVLLDGKPLHRSATVTVMLHKPTGYVVSRNGQGSRTMYDLLPSEYGLLKPVGRLDKDSSGLLLLTNDGALANELTHPRHDKQKVYEVMLDHQLTQQDEQALQHGVTVEDYVSHLQVTRRGTGLVVTMRQGKNRQIRKTFAALGYVVTNLHRIQFGTYKLGRLKAGAWQSV